MSGHFRVAGCLAMVAALGLTASAAWAEGSPSGKSDPAAQPSVILTITPPPGGFPAPPSNGTAAPQVEASPSPAPGTESSPPSAQPGAESSPPSPEQAPAEAPAPEIVQEPPPPPAHPVVAIIRAKLAESAKGDDSAALQEFYATRTEPPLWTTDTGLSPKAQAAIKEIQDANQWGLDARAFDPPSAEVQLASVEEQADAEIKLGLAILKYARYARGGRLQPSRINKLFDQRPPVRAPKDVLAEIAASDAPDAYLRSLHPHHPQFQKLREALVNAGGDPYQVQLITANMERWRWLPAELGAFHIWNNVPEFNTRVVKGGQTIYVEKTIVGELKYATPFFSAPMRSVVFHPEWNVPETIVREDLQPALQRGGGGFFGGANFAVLQKHGLRVSLKGQPIDPRTVDWSTANIKQYTFTQPAGPANVLGKFKFNFPNRHAVYMHDTVQPELFAKPVRTLSHGCIRVNQPERLAAFLLAEDKGWSPEKVRSMLDGGTQQVALSRHIPVHLTYFTAVVNESGHLQTFPDYYGLDNPTVQALFGSSAVRFQGPSVPAGEIVSQVPPPRQQTETRRSGNRNPVPRGFSGLFGN